MYDREHTISKKDDDQLEIGLIKQLKVINIRERLHNLQGTLLSFHIYYLGREIFPPVAEETEAQLTQLINRIRTSTLKTLNFKFCALSPTVGIVGVKEEKQKL